MRTGPQGVLKKVHFARNPWSILQFLLHTPKIAEKWFILLAVPKVGWHNTSRENNNGKTLTVF